MHTKDSKTQGWRWEKRSHQGPGSTWMEVGWTLAPRTQPSNQDQGSTGMEEGEEVTPRAQ